MEQTTTPYLGIRQLAEDDRPREKLHKRGPTALSYTELLAILIGSGNRRASALQLASQVLELANNNLSDLSRLSLKQLTGVHGIGPNKALTLAAAIELGRRRREEQAKQVVQIHNSQDAYQYFEPFMDDYLHEEFWILLLNRNHMVLSKKRVSTGGVAGTVVDPKVVFHLALESLASSIILCHNHPSGNLKPSSQDLEITRKLCQGARFLDLNIADHLIIGNREFFSFSDNGLLNF